MRFRSTDQHRRIRSWLPGGQVSLPATAGTSWGQAHHRRRRRGVRSGLRAVAAAPQSRCCWGRCRDDAGPTTFAKAMEGWHWPAARRHDLYRYRPIALRSPRVARSALDPHARRCGDELHLCRSRCMRARAQGRSRFRRRRIAGTRQRVSVSRRPRPRSAPRWRV